jgi:hypothetical protein
VNKSGNGYAVHQVEHFITTQISIINSLVFNNNNNNNNYYYYYLTCGPDNVATRNGLGGLGIHSRWGGVCFVPVCFVPTPTASEAHPASRTGSTGSLPGVKRPERRADRLPHSTSEVANGSS